MNTARSFAPRLAAALLAPLSLALNSSQPLAADVVTDVSVYGAHGCALYSSGDVWCWGLFPGEEDSFPFTAKKVQGLPEAIAIDVNRLGSCAVTRNGDAMCWGIDLQATIREKKGVIRSTPFKIDGLPAISLIVAGWLHYCALSKEGQVWCWGSNGGGELGLGDKESRDLPAQVPGFPAARALAAGVNNTCAVLFWGEMSCWGTDNPTGAGGGNAFVFQSEKPLLLASEKFGYFDNVENGRNFACGIRDTGQITCWGSNVLGQIGTKKLRVQMSLFGGIGEVDHFKEAEDIALTDFGGCGVERGEVRCWGELSFRKAEEKPTKIAGLRAAKKVALGDYFGCATDGHRVSCWGSNEYEGKEMILGMELTKAVAVPGLPGSE